jgi:uncharacterized protein
VSELKLDADFQARVRQTGQIPMDDDEFGTITQNAGLTMTTSFVLVCVILWLALRSLRIVAAVVVSLVFGLAVSAAAGLFLVGAFNLISIAFFALFVGLGVDFAIQFSVRYRAERYEQPICAPPCEAPPSRPAVPWRLPPWRSQSGFRHSCRPTISVSPSSAKSPESA